MEDGLSSGVGIEDNVDLHLTRTVFVNREGGYVEMDISLHNYNPDSDTEFTFLVDGIEKIVFDTNMKQQSFKQLLERGEHVL